MTDDSSKKFTGKNHSGSERTAPYPVSRLAPAFELVDLAKQISATDAILNTRVNAKLRVIADQIRHLQDEARRILEQTQQDQQLHQAQCQFKRQPGKTYHLYRKADGQRYFSMLSPADWQQQPPHEFVGSYRLEADMSWTDLAQQAGADKPDSEDIVQRLLEEHVRSLR